MPSISRLTQLDDLKTGDLHGIPVYLHTEHRWTLPLLREAQEKQRVPCPCHLIVFDRHHDAVAPTCLPELRTIRARGSKTSELVDLCEHHLRTLDDDWIKAAMELGLVDDAMVFGVETRDLSRDECTFEDHTGVAHQIVLTRLPGDELGYQGDLSDVARREEMGHLWDVLGWSSKSGKGFSFSPTTDKAYLTIDLDCFVVSWKEYLFPWPEEVYRDKFIRPSDYPPTREWTGKRFFDGLLERAGVVDIAREPSCCGGEAKSRMVLDDVNRHLFDGRLSFE